MECEPLLTCRAPTACHHVCMLQVMEVLRSLCAEGHAVAVTIHQPRSAIFALLDDVLLIAKASGFIAQRFTITSIGVAL